MTSTVPVKPGRLETVLFYFYTGKYSSNYCAVFVTWNCSMIDCPYLEMYELQKLFIIMHLISKCINLWYVCDTRTSSPYHKLYLKMDLFKSSLKFVANSAPVGQTSAERGLSYTANVTYSWIQTVASFWMMYAFF